MLASKLAALALTTDQVRAFIADPANASPAYQAILADLTARGLGEFIELDLSIVRGLAYYTGVVFEVFDSKKSMRAVAGGGRYDTLVATISDGAVDLPATGFAMGDYVIRNLIEETTHAAMQMEVWLQRNAAACDVFVVVADESMRPASLRLVTELRRAGIAADLPLTPAKVAKQFQSAERSGARFALVVGAEYPGTQTQSAGQPHRGNRQRPIRRRVANRPPAGTRRAALGLTAIRLFVICYLLFVIHISQ